MLNKSKKIFAGILCLSIFVSAFSIAQKVSAADILYFTPQVEIPNSAISGSVAVGGVDSQGNIKSLLLAKYIAAIYNYGLSIGGILAAVMLMAGGLIWLTSGGDSGKVGQAKKIIGGSLVGLCLLFGAYLLLNTVNPDLVTLKGVDVIGIKATTTQAAYMACDGKGTGDSCKLTENSTMGSGYCEQTTCTPCIQIGGTCTHNVTNEDCISEIGICGNAVRSADRNDCDCSNDICTCKGTVSGPRIDCSGLSDGTSCQLTVNNPLGSGYCEDEVCKACVPIGGICTHNITNEDCAGKNNLCGNTVREADENDCDCSGGSCTCKLND